MLVGSEGLGRVVEILHFGELQVLSLAARVI